jgi:GH15 family glucan-1,4-alpha-glucosidase
MNPPGSLSTAAQPRRTAGYAPLRDYAAIGDGRTVALVARDGAIDWLCLPDLHSPSVLGALLDAERGGSFMLAPEEPFAVERRYLPDTNVLETTFCNATGAVRVIDALTLTEAGLAPARELVRRVEGISGTVAMRWSLAPRFDYARRPARMGRRSGIPIAEAGGDALAVCSWEAGEPQLGDGRVDGRFVIQSGETALIALCFANQEPLVLPPRDEVEARLSATCAFWRAWAAARAYDGPWREAVVRSALALKLLVHAPSGAIAAAATTSLPEALGGERNWDYRFCWVRDSAFTLDALLRLGCGEEAHAFFWWLLHASQLTHPRLQVLYRLDGGARARERELALAGYRGSRPVRIGNDAAAQLQLDVYGDLLQTAWLYSERAGRLDPDTGQRLAEMADLVCAIWRRPDAGIWEVRSAPAHFTHSKAMCWVALDRALRLAEAGRIPSRHAARWTREREAIRQFVEGRCWAEESGGSYLRAADGEELDAALLLLALMGYSDPQGARLPATIEAVRRELGRGPLLARYSGEDGVEGREGAFLACSFWLVDALARGGRVEEAARTMEELLALANDVGLYSEEIDPGSGDFLGNLPQGLVHLALVNAAASCAEAGA